MNNLNNVLHGNNVDVMKSLPDNSIDLTVTSPPYGTLRTYKGVIDSTKYNEHFSFPFVDIVEQLYRITKDGGIVVWVINDQVDNGGESGDSFRQALHFIEKGFKLYDTMIYHKNGSAYHEAARYDQVFEYMFVFLKGKRPKTVNIIKDKPNKWAGSKTFGTPSTRQKDGSIKKMKEGFTIAEYGARYNVWYVVNSKGFGGDKLSYEHPACVDIYTECLTKNGWKKYNEININDIILSYNIFNDTLEWDSVKDIHISEYHGDIYEANSRRLSMIITPNHRNVIELNGKISIKETSELKNRHNILTSCPLNSNYEKINENVAYLLGIIITDGHISNGIHITQDYNYNKEVYDKIINALNALEVNYSVSKRRRYYTYIGTKKLENKISIDEKDIEKYDYYKVSYCSDINILDKNLIDEIIKFIPDKKITELIYNLDNNSLNKIIEGIIDGDGVIRCDKGNSYVITGKYEEFHSNLQILAFLAGYTADCITNSNNKIYTQLTKNRSKNLRNSKESLLEKKKFDGIVWCPEVEKNGTWIARKNGKLFITGNSFPESLAEDHILSWSNEGDIVFDPMCGSGTTLKMAKINNRNFIGIDINEEYVKLSEERVKNAKPYTDKKPNEKLKFIVSREETLEKRKSNKKK